jgi:hypothetical protein
LRVGFGQEQSGEKHASPAVEAACVQEYAAKKARGETGGQKQASYVGACLARATTDPDPPAVAHSFGDTGHSSNTDLAKKAQNPIGDLYVIPFNNFTNFDVGPHKGTQNVLEIEPVIPIHINEDWNIITRTILPLVWNPSFAPAHVAGFGSAPTQMSSFLAPRNDTNGWLWGVGPIVQAPTISSATLGSSVWGGGPTAVIVHTGDQIVAGVLVNNVWSFGGREGPHRTKYNMFLVEPFINYNFGDGWFAFSDPSITANWEAKGTKWTVPVGGGAGKIVKLGGKLPIKLEVGVFYNVVKPTGAGHWFLNTSLAIIF